MFRCLNLLLLIYFNNYSESSGNTPRSVIGNIGSSVTLSCEFEDRDIFHIDLIRFKKIICVCHNDECESENGRVFKEGSCDVIIKDLRLSDAGKYLLRVHYTDVQRELKQHTLQYHLHIQGEISVKKGEQLKLDVLLINADKVEKNSSGEWTEVWTRGHGVRNERLIDRDGKLTINEFTVTDTGTYRVLDSEGEIWITVTVTESSPGSNGKLDTDEEQHTAGFWILSVGLPVLVILVLVLEGVTVVIKKWCLGERYSQGHRSPEELDLY